MTFLAAGLVGARDLLLQFILKVLGVRINKCIVLFIYLSVCFSCIYVCASCVCLVLMEVRKGHWMPGTGVMHDRELIHGWWKSNQGPL